MLFRKELLKSVKHLIKLECKANYCNLNEFKRDDRRKTWYRVNPDVWGKGT